VWDLTTSQTDGRVVSESGVWDLISQSVIYLHTTNDTKSVVDTGELDLYGIPGDFGCLTTGKGGQVAYGYSNGDVFIFVPM
jgi:hypothetical protein